MVAKRIRQVSPRQWTGLVLAASALGSMAEARVLAPSTSQSGDVWLAQAQGGEGGEAGAVAGVDPETAYLVRIAIVEGHLLAAAALYEKGMVDDAIGLSYHPEAEMMDEVREGLAANNAADFTPLMQTFSNAMENGANAGPALSAFQDAATTAMGTPDAAARFRVAVAVLKASAAEYSHSIEGGEVTDALAYHEAQAFVTVAKGMLVPLANDAAVGTLATRAIAAMEPAATAFGAENGAFIANDPAILLGVAARVELLASQVR